MDASLIERAEAIAPWVIELRRELHRHPELMYEEVKTSALVRRTLDELGVSYRYPLAETGVLAQIGSGDGPCVALRADMDALPVSEEADVPFASEVPGKMHACGHDCHTAMLLGAARLLKEREDELGGVVKLLFQPAEEGGAGGRRMREEGALADPPVERIFGLHVWPLLPTGMAGSRAGCLLAATASLRIVIHGKGGHAALPHLCVDPVMTAGKVLVELQSLVARELDPLSPGVVSVTAVHGGEAYNVIPEQVELRGTLRALDAETMALLRERVTAIATAVCEANRCRAEVDFPGNSYPPTTNAPEAWALARRVAGELLGPEQVVEMPPIMGGEDFAFYLEEVPGCFVALGSRNEAIGAVEMCHHPRFKVDEAALARGVALHVALASEAIRELRAAR